MPVTFRSTFGLLPLAAALAMGGCDSTPVDAREASTPAPARATSQSAEPARVREYIERANARLVQTFVDGDASAAAAMFTDDAILMLNGPEAATGRAAIERLLAGTFAAVKFRGIDVEIVEVTLAGDMAYEVGQTVMTYEAGGRVYRERGKYLVAWKRVGGGEWKIHRDVSNSSGFIQ